MIWFKRYILFTGSIPYVRSTHLVKKICLANYCSYVLALPFLAYKSVSLGWFLGWVSPSLFLKLIGKMFLTRWFSRSDNNQYAYIFCWLFIKIWADTSPVLINNSWTGVLEYIPIIPLAWRLINSCILCL